MPIFSFEIFGISKKPSCDRDLSKGAQKMEKGMLLIKAPGFWAQGSSIHIASKCIIFELFSSASTETPLKCLLSSLSLCHASVKFKDSFPSPYPCCASWPLDPLTQELPTPFQQGLSDMSGSS